MAQQKFYAVAVGRQPGIYNSWAECQAQINGFSGAVYKSFSTLDSAKEYIKALNKSEDASTATPSEVVAYIDGSYEKTTGVASWGIVVLRNGKEEHFSGKVENPSLLEMWNVAGELSAAMTVMQYCAIKGVKSVDIYYDYAGIEAWCTGAWKASKPGTIAYCNFCESIKRRLSIRFFKVAAHTGNKYNEIADQLAKDAL